MNKFLDLERCKLGSPYSPLYGHVMSFFWSLHFSSEGFWNIWKCPGCLLFVEKYLLLKSHTFPPQYSSLATVTKWGGLEKQKLKLACFYSVPMPRPLLMVSGGEDCGGYFWKIYFYSYKLSWLRAVPYHKSYHLSYECWFLDLIILF